MALPYLTRAGLVPEPVAARTGPGDADRRGRRPALHVAGDILDYADLFQADGDFPYDEKAFDKHVRKTPRPAAEGAGGAGRDGAV